MRQRVRSKTTYFGGRGPPSQLVRGVLVRAALQPVRECSLGEVKLGCDLLRELVVGRESCIVPDDDGGRVASEGLGGEGVDRSERDLAGRHCCRVGSRVKR